MTTMSRRAFLRGTVALGAGAILYRYADGFRIVTAAGATVRQMRLIHTNDHHSRIEPATGITIKSGVTRNLGGVARRKTLFDQYRADNSVPDKIFLDAGDIFQGTLYFNQYNGQADLFFYNALNYAALAIGNHEFDKGDQVLADYIKSTTYPTVAANMTAVAPSPLAALYQEVLPEGAAGGGKWGKRTSFTLPSGKKVGIFGLTTVETANISSPSANVTFDPEYAKVAQAQVDALKLAGCDTIIALTHIGYDADLLLAPQLRGVHLIVGGHSHTPLLSDLQKDLPFGAARVAAYPQVIADLDGNSTVIVQDWEWAKWVGDITIGFDAAGLVSEVVGKNIQPVWADGLGSPARALITGEGAEITPDATFLAKITNDYKPAIAVLSSTIIGATLVDLPNTTVRASENALGNFIADSFRDYLVKRPAGNPNNYPIVAIINGGGVRTSVSAGVITVAKMLEVQPFGNQVSYVDLTGAQIKAALENGVSALQPGAGLDASRNAVGTGRFPQVSGLRYTISPGATAAQVPYPATSTQAAIPARAGGRISNIQVLVGSAYVPIDPVKIYRVVTNNFMLTGGDGYTAFTTGGDLADPSVGGAKNPTNTFLIDADITQDYLKAQTNATISPKIEGRITLSYSVFLPQVSQPAAATTVAPAN